MGQWHKDSKKSPNATQTHKNMFNETTRMVFVKEYCNSLEKEFRLLKKRVVIDSSMPSELPRKGLDAMREWYLYQAIRPLVMTIKISHVLNLLYQSQK